MVASGALMACGPRDTLGRPTESVPVWDAASSAGVRPNITVEAPTSRRYEDDPWLSDWTNDAPYYRPGPPCDGYAARIGERTFASLTEAVEEAAPYDVVELCPGEHHDAATIGAARPLEIRGVTGEPSDVLWNIPIDPSRPWHTLAPDQASEADTTENWVRVSGMTLSAESIARTDSSALLFATRIELRDLVLVDLGVVLIGDKFVTSERVASAPGGWGQVDVDRSEDHPSETLVVALRSLYGHPTVAGRKSGLRIIGDFYGSTQVEVRDTQLEVGAGNGVWFTGQAGRLAPNPSLEWQLDIRRLRIVGGEAEDPTQASYGIGVHVQSSRESGACRAQVDMSESSFANLTGSGAEILSTWSVPGEFDCDPGSPLVASLQEVTFYRNGTGFNADERATISMQDVDFGSGPRDNVDDFYGCATDYGLLSSATLRQAIDFCPEL
jgi:hypothetical protein